MKTRSGRRSAAEDGQATVEFALVMTLLVGLFLFMLKLTLVFAFGNYVHYATFMSARAYLSSAKTTQEQEEHARNVIVQMLKKTNQPSTDRFAFVAKGVDGQDDDGGGQVLGFYVGTGEQYQADNINYSWMEGVRYKFRSGLFMIPFGGISRKRQKNDTIELMSESWLGKEPSYLECQKYMNETVHGIYDNGC